MKTRKSLIAVLSLLALVSVSAGVSVAMPYSADAQTEVVRQEGLQVDGFSVRVNVSPNDQTGPGVRFHVGMTEELYNSLLNAEKTGFKEGVSTGTVIIPTELKGTGDLTKDTPNATVKDTSNVWFEKDGAMQSVVYLWDIPQNNYGNDISVVGYINDNGTITYSDEAARSMSWVAKEEYDDPESEFDADMKAALKETYIDKTVTITDGEDVETKTVAYGETLTIEEPTKAGYTFDGWFNQAGTAEWNMENAVKNSIKLYAQWTRNSGYEVLADFDATTVNDYVSQADRFQFAIVNGSEVTVGAQTGTELGITGKALKIDDIGITETGRTWVEFATLPLANINFDYMMIRGYVDHTLGSGRSLMLQVGTESGTRETLITFEPGSQPYFEIKISKSQFALMTDSTNFRLLINNWATTAGQLKAIYITDVVGRYNNVEADTSINLLETTGLTANEITSAYFENTSGTQTPISDVTAFTATEAGKIVMNISVKGYAPSTLEIKVVKYPAYNVLDDFTGDVNNYKSQADRFQFTIVDGAEVTVGTQTGAELGLTGKALKIDDIGTTETGRTWVEFATLPLANISFDYVTVRGYVDHTLGSGRSLALQVGTESGTRETLITFEPGSQPYFEIKISKSQFALMTDSTNFRLLINNWATTAGQLKAIYITDITGGYNDVAVDEAVNLVETTGLTANEITDAYFENATGTQTTISDVTAFTPTETGTITFVVVKDGYKDTAMTVNVVAAE